VRSGFLRYTEGVKLFPDRGRAALAAVPLAFAFWLPRFGIPQTTAPPPPPPPSPAAPPGPPAPAVPAAGPASLLATADEVLAQMSRITGLPIKAPLNKQIVDRASVRRYVAENLESDLTPEQLYVQEATLKAFGLVAADFNLKKFLIDFYTEQAAGYYDPRRKTMFMANWVDPDLERMVLTHELTHALQDQNFDLQKFLFAERDNDDATSARQAVVEGYATAAMMQALLEPVDLAQIPSLSPLLDQVMHRQMEEFPTFSSAPFFFRFQALFPYSQGLGFMQQGLRLGGWAELNQIFVHPPESTREIFDPPVYFRHLRAPAVALPAPPPLAAVKRLRLLDENILGELGYYSLVGQLVSEEEAKSLGGNWRADRYRLYEDEDAAGHYTLVARSRWANSEAALQFFRDDVTILGKKYPGLVPDRRSTTDLYIASTPGGNVILMRKGSECLWAEGIPRAATPAMLNYLEGLP
jgi:hypothetical protein